MAADPPVELAGYCQVFLRDITFPLMGRGKQIPRRFAPRNDKASGLSSFGGLREKKRARHVFRALLSGSWTMAVLNRTWAGVIDVNDRGRDVNPRHAWDVHAHSRAVDLWYANNYGTEIGPRKAHAG